MKRNIRAFIYPEDAGFVIEVPDVHVATQGDTLEEAIANMKEVISLALEEEDLADFWLVPDPSVIVTIDLGPLTQVVSMTRDSLHTDGRGEMT